MSEDEQIAATQADAPAAEPADTQSSAQTAGDGATQADQSAPAGDTENAAARLAELERQLAAERDAATDYMQRWQRAVADFTNFKRRTQQEQEQREKLLVAQALMPVLYALDNFERAFATLPDSLRGYSWIEGVALTELPLRRALETHGITEVPAEAGQAFDPAHHEAVGEVETDQHPAGQVAVVLQRGYQIGGLLLRPALVQVARAPGAPASPSASPASPSSEADGKSETTSGGAEAPEETQPSGPAP